MEQKNPKRYLNPVGAIVGTVASKNVILYCFESSKMEAKIVMSLVRLGEEKNECL